MAIGGTDLRVTLRGQLLGNVFEVPQWYRLSGAAFLTATPTGVGEAWWNNIKAAWRALYISTTTLSFEDVRVEEPGTLGQYGTFAIPSGEKQGTRSATSDNESLPPFLAAGVRLAVGSRVTRPGQKRPPLLIEDDTNAGNLSANFISVLNPLMQKYVDPMVLGAPVATGTMQPEICRINTVTREITAKQDVVGYVVNPHVTTQNSRKYGRGI